MIGLINEPDGYTNPRNSLHYLSFLFRLFTLSRTSCTSLSLICLLSLSLPHTLSIFFLILSVQREVSEMEGMLSSLSAMCARLDQTMQQVDDGEWQLELFSLLV